MNTKELRLQIGKNARQCRKELGYTQEVLAEKCGLPRHTARRSRLVRAYCHYQNLLRL